MTDLQQGEGRRAPAPSKLTLAIPGFWVIGWLFAIGFAKLGFWCSLPAILLWPYFVGAELAR